LRWIGSRSQHLRNQRIRVESDRGNKLLQLFRTESLCRWLRLVVHGTRTIARILSGGRVVLVVRQISLLLRIGLLLLRIGLLRALLPVRLLLRIRRLPIARLLIWGVLAGVRCVLGILRLRIRAIPILRIRCRSLLCKEFSLRRNQEEHHHSQCNQAFEGRAQDSFGFHVASLQATDSRTAVASSRAHTSSRRKSRRSGEYHRPRLTELVAASHASSSTAESLES
jgi:hypothetical protein